MSFFQGDSRPGEQPAPPPRALTPVEIGVIIGTITVFIASIAALFVYRSRKAKKRSEESGEGHTQLETVHHKSDDASSRELVGEALPPPTSKKRIWDEFGTAKAYERDDDVKLREESDMERATDPEELLWDFRVNDAQMPRPGL